MLGKLIKYEFKATGRLLIPLYGALIIFAFINKIFMGDFFSNTNTILGNIPKVIGMLVYIATMISIFVVTFFIIIQRYRTNLLGDEGYLMNTLPVKSWENILSKLIVAFVWSIISVIVAIISIIILAYKKGMFSDIIYLFSQLFNEIDSSAGIHGTIFMLELLLAMLIGSAVMILMIYAALSLGSLFNKRKILASFGAFLFLNIATNTIASFIQMPVVVYFDKIFFNMNNEFLFQPLHLIMVISILLTIIGGVAYFVISNYVLSKKLNLE